MECQIAAVIAPCWALALGWARCSVLRKTYSTAVPDALKSDVDFWGSKDGGTVLLEYSCLIWICPSSCCC